MSDVMLKDDLEKVLAELEAQGVDLTVIKDALANSGGVVKSVQRGVVTVTAGSTKKVSISAVDPNKSFVNLRGAPLIIHNGGPEAILVGFTEDTISIKNLDGGYSVDVSYEVVEFC